ncbi:GNAT family N-acetyltransferase [Erwinia aphidicola]|jgi:GNAT superfamily N-acetyltransferase|uniref:GNAT family N-acetyltransferase n=1 Tax=Erwinia aphidicola TaxID=68334 RepID=A0ABU8DI43_ERWAP|nr:MULTISPECIES: GNAT family N-acetyltransferase [Erwinia]KMV71352.1 GCN5 family acetyltransferase [bacteria symbiont BFo1 of Frankliniella occidentalis]KYP85294.1 GCN5 family acetyltransferase [bacteria symbiont BFo1 of Frankliniella occidentalis]KYP90714.1 GCN5 family acetyltransferase [bacteria symbiont BFo1 of Frankliniella occidentalis]MCP2229705.1 GNAT superfamily N-acetyltransferase [Erwinia aphidicola]MDI3440135.1 GNAT family N-acetyltransferase [Erwinia sp. V90_4]
MNIRPFTEADRPFLRTLFLASRKANWTWLDDAEWQLEDFDRVTLGERVLVAEEDGHRVGFAAVLDNDNFLHSLFIDPAWQGSGAGSALLQAVQNSFTSTGALKCLAENLQAQSFYKKHGWRVVAQGESDQGEYLLMHYVLK